MSSRRRRAYPQPNYAAQSPYGATTVPAGNAAPGAPSAYSVDQAAQGISQMNINGAGAVPQGVWCSWRCNSPQSNQSKYSNCRCQSCQFGILPAATSTVGPTLFSAAGPAAAAATTAAATGSAIPTTGISANGTATADLFESA